MRIAFAGTPPFAAAALEALHAAGHDLTLVLTQPDRPSGRGLKLTPSAVATWASGRGLPVHKPASLKDPASQEPLRKASVEVLVVAAYGLILPPAVLSMPARGCLNIHASLLPRWRGAAPVQRAILAGDRETGITIMAMDAGLDTGPILLQKSLPIRSTDTAASLTERLSRLGAESICEALESLATLVAAPQDGAQATYARKIDRAEARIDWTRPNEEIERQLRALDPAPGSETTLAGEPLKIWRGLLAEGRGRPGEVLQIRNNHPLVACGRGALEILELQRPGARRLPAAEFMRGAALVAGQILGEKPLASA